MADSRLNETERSVQQPFRTSYLFNGLIMAVAVTAAYLEIRALPTLPSSPDAFAALTYRPVELAPVAGSFHLAGAWVMKVSDRRFGGISSLAIDHGQFLAVSDRGAVTRFDRPGTLNGQAWVADLRLGPGRWGRKWTRDAEALVADPGGRGWWVGYEQRHSLWLYDRWFKQALANINLNRRDWWHNRGAEGLTTEGDRLLVVAENGRDSMLVSNAGAERLALEAGADVAEASRAPDGTAWLLLRTKGLSGIRQSVANLIRTDAGYQVRTAWPVPKGPFDNFEGMAIEALPGGGMRFWLISDDGHRIMARNLLVALDYVPPARHDKSPATGAGLSRQPNGNAF